MTNPVLQRSELVLRKEGNRFRVLLYIILWVRDASLN